MSYIIQELCGEIAELKQALAEKDRELQQIREHEFQHGYRAAESIWEEKYQQLMAQAVWTTKKPTKRGWYWLRMALSKSTLIIWVYPYGDSLLCRSTETSACSIDNIQGEWSSEPIQEPKEHQS